MIHPILASLVVLISAVSLPAANVAPSPPVLKEDGADFVRMGQATFRWKSVVKIYDITLHIGAGQLNAKALDDVPMRLELVYYRAFTAADIIKGGDTLLRRNVFGDTFERLAPRLAEFNRAYVNVKPGDSYTLTYVPGRGTTLRLNGDVLATVPGYDFAAAYFRIWLGDEPMSSKLRDDLLGH
ncbi:MAG: chalcone isomerase family protein [Verrucomicrobia bacterium]|nr:chalcone isomerase family protein [Verrucomicrobiota bacterium]